MAASVDAAIAPIFGPPGTPPPSAPTNAIEEVAADPVVETVTQDVVRAETSGATVHETVVTRRHESGFSTQVTRGGGVREVATGLNRHTAAKELARCEPAAHLADGLLLIEGLPVAYRFATNANTLVVVEQRKDGAVRSRAALAGLVYLDYRTGRSILLAVPQNCAAQWTGSDVVYSNAFGNGIEADIVYRVRRSGLEQDVILRSVPPSPSSFGLRNDATRLCILTELVGERPDKMRVDSPDERNAFVPSPEPLELLRVEGSSVREVAHYATGWAYGREDRAAIGGGAGTGTPEAGRRPVDHRIVTLGSRVFLCEEVATQEIRAWMLDQPAVTKAAKDDMKALLARADAVPKPVEPPSRPVAVPSGPAAQEMQVAWASVPGGRDFVLDYIDANAPPGVNYTFEAGQTYYVSSEFQVQDLTIQPGAVVKLAANASVVVAGRLFCETTPAKPAYFTSCFDDSVGETIPGLSGDPWDPLNRCAPAALILDGDYAAELNSLHFRHAGGGLYLQGSGAISHVVRDCTFVDVGVSIMVASGGGSNDRIEVSNCLFAEADLGVAVQSVGALHARFCTWHDVGTPLAIDVQSVPAVTLEWNLFASASVSTSDCGANAVTTPNASYDSVDPSTPGWTILASEPFDGSNTSRPYALNQSVTALIDQGPAADTVGLSLYTTQPSDPGEEGTSAADFGFHYYVLREWEIDTDQDGLPDVQEVVLGTDTNNPDSDWDGWSDGDEVAAGTSPLSEWWYPQPVQGTVTIVGTPGRVVVEARSGSNVRHVDADPVSGAYTLYAAPWYCHRIIAFADQDYDGVWDEGEPRGDYAANDLYLGWDAYGIDFTLDATVPFTTKGSVSGTITHAGDPGPIRLVLKRTNAPSLHFSFDDTSGAIVDESGNNHAATASGATWTDQGKFGGGYAFAGDGSHVVVGDEFDLDASTRSQLTVSAWVKLATGSGYQDFVSKNQEDWPYTGWALQSTEGTAFADLIGAYPERAWQWSTNVVGDGEWHFVAGQWLVETDRLRTKLFVDGALVGECNYRGWLSGTDGSSPLTIGARDPAGGSAFNGTLDDVRIYEADLTPEQLVAVAAGGPADAAYTHDLPGAGAYTFPGLPLGGPCELLAFRDLDEDGQLDENEPWASVPVLQIAGDLTGIDLTIPAYLGDTDGDGMPDAWEDANGLNKYDSSDAQFDPQNNGFTALLRYQAGVTVTGQFNFVDASSLATYEQRTLSSRRSLAAEGIHGFNGIKYYRSVNITGRNEWKIYAPTRVCDGVTNPPVVVDEGEIDPVRIPLVWSDFVDGTCADQIWTVSGAEIEGWRKQRDTNGTLTTDINVKWNWNGTSVWTRQPDEWQNGAATTVSVVWCGSCSTTVYPQVPPWVGTGTRVVHSNDYAEGPWASYSVDWSVTNGCAANVYAFDHAGDGIVRISLGGEVTITDIVAEVRADVANTALLTTRSFTSDVSETTWVRDTCAVSPCGGIASLLHNGVSAAAKAGEYRFTLTNSVAQTFYVVNVMELTEGAAKTSASPRTYFKWGTGSNIVFGPFAVPAPSTTACVRVGASMVAIDDAQLCWFPNGTVDLASPTMMNLQTDPVTDQRVIWSVEPLPGSQGTATLTPGGSRYLTLGENGGAYRVTVRSIAFPDIKDVATLKVVRVAFATNSSVVYWTSNGFFNAADKILMPQSGPTGWQWSVTAFSGGPLATSLYDGVFRMATNGGIYDIVASSKDCSSCTATMTLAVLKVDLLSMSELANPANTVFNSTPKDDPPSIRSNCLYLVEEPASGRFIVKLNVLDQPPVMRGLLMHAVYHDGNKLATGEGYFPASGPATIVFDHPTTAGLLDDFEIRVGYDLNRNGIMEAGESPYPLDVKDSSGRVIGPTIVRGVGTECYAAARAAIFVGTYASFLPHTAYQLDLFRDPLEATRASLYQPSAINTVGLNCFGGDFSEWLTHNSGALFPASGSTTVLEYAWNTSSTFATNLVGNSFEVTNALTTFFATVVLAEATSYFATSAASTATFPLSGSYYDIPHFSYSTGLPPTTVFFDDPALNNAYEDDPYTAIARARLVDHRARFSVERIPVPGGAFTVNLVEIRHHGELTDLYDFNIEAAFPAPFAAIVQIGFGNGVYGRTEGQIYRTKVDWDLKIP